MQRAISIVELAKLLQDQADRIRSGQSSHELTDLVTRELATDAIEGLDRSQDLDDRPFQPLNRPRRDGTSKPLVATGTLREALESLRSQPSMARDAGPWQSIRQQVPYSVYHQMGTRRIPRRRFFGPGKRFRTRMGRALTSWVQHWLENMGGG